MSAWWLVLAFFAGAVSAYLLIVEALCREGERAEGRAEGRAAIVAWLRSYERPEYHDGFQMADAIERGEHEEARRG